MIALAWPMVVLALGLLTLAALWDFLHSWLRGIRSERQVLATGLEEVRKLAVETSKSVLKGANEHQALVGHFGELADKLKKLDARVLDERELRARR